MQRAGVVLPSSAVTSALWQAVGAEHARRNFWERVPEGVPAALEHMAHTAPEIFKTARGQLPLFLEFWAQASRDPAVKKATIAPYRRYCHFFAALIRAGQAEGSLRPMDADMAGQTLVSLALGLLLQGLLDPHGTDWEQAAQGEVLLFIEALRQR